jgi:hypothetical protein
MSSQPPTLLNHANRHTCTPHRSTSRSAITDPPFFSIPGTRSAHSILAQQRVMSIPCHTAGPCRSIPQFGSAPPLYVNSALTPTSTLHLRLPIYATTTNSRRRHRRAYGGYDRRGKVSRYEIRDIRAATPRPLIPIGAPASSRGGSLRRGKRHGQRGWFLCSLASPPVLCCRRSAPKVWVVALI